MRKQASLVERRFLPSFSGSKGVFFLLLAGMCLWPAAAVAQSETDYYDNGIDLMGRKKFAEAEAEFRKSVKADPRYKEAWQALAEVLRAEGKTAQAAAVDKIAAAATEPRAGAAPPLSAEQLRVLNGVDLPPAGPETPPVAAPVKPEPANPAEGAVPPGPVPDGGPANPPAVPAVPAPAPVALDVSAIVNRNAKGVPAVAAKNGRPVEGIKLSRHDLDILSPGLAVTPGGNIHLVFVEQHAQTYEYAVYHRSSADGGKTWTDAKNLSEVMPGWKAGDCKVAADGRGRVYVFWRTGVAPNYSPDNMPHSMPHNNIVYRLYENGSWSGRAIPVHPMHPREEENDADSSWFVNCDPNGNVHVIWNMFPDSRHPERMATPRATYRSNAIGTGMVMQVDLDGATPSPPREIYLAKIAMDTNYNSPGCDALDLLNGYVDAAGTAHMLAQINYAGVGKSEGVNHFHILENGTDTPAIDLPGTPFAFWRNPPTLLQDARGKRHIIALYPGGEQPNVRDCLVGSDNEPTVIRAAQMVKGKLHGFQAFEGPRGRMVAVMEMNDTGKDTDDELYVSTSDGGAWSTPVNVTNNSGRQDFHVHETSAFGASHVATESYWFPSQAAAVYDKQGHLVLAHISNKMTILESVALGWTMTGTSTRTPNLLFLRF